MQTVSPRTLVAIAFTALVALPCPGANLSEPHVEQFGISVNVGFRVWRASGSDWQVESRVGD